MQKGIKNIIFDLGGVILDIDYQRTVDAFKAAGLSRFEDEFIQSHQSAFFQSYECGAHSDEEFYDYIRKFCSLKDSEIDYCWNAMLLRIPLRRLQILQQLQLHYNTFLLSNTNSIHEKAFNSMLKNVCGYEHFGVFFDKVYLSHRIGMRKPDAEIFKKVINDNALNTHETIFIDDSIQHITSAQQLGLHTIHLHGGMTIENDIFKSLHQ